MCVYIYIYIHTYIYMYTDLIYTYRERDIYIHTYIHTYHKRARSSGRRPRPASRPSLPRHSGTASLTIIDTNQYLQHSYIEYNSYIHYNSYINYTSYEISNSKL